MGMLQGASSSRRRNQVTIGLAMEEKALVRVDDSAMNKGQLMACAGMCIACTIDPLGLEACHQETKNDQGECDVP